ncbi:MAG: heparinase II/III-family protein [Bryobacteraceae bacterium]|nr:heparinase II/III-family protein [Bryobacteraceae bacterium]
MRVRAALLLAFAIPLPAQERFPKPAPASAFSGLKIFDAGSPIRTPKEDWDEARKKVRGDAQWAAWLREQQAECDAWMEAHPTDRVEWIAGWWHDFVDGKTGAFLPWTPVPPPGVSDRVMGGWVFGFRTRHTQRMVQAARLWRLTGEGRYADWVIRQLNFYAANYEKWPVQTEKSKARLMYQSLDEANVLVRLAEAARLVQERASPGQRKEWADRLLRPMALLLDETFQRVHNIAVWQRSATAMAALCLRDGPLWERAIDGPFGLRRQMADGVTSDFLWIEQSFGYNSYVVSALLPLFIYAGLEGRLDELRREAEIAENLMLAPSVLRFPDGRLPMPADTTGGFQRWPNEALLEAARRVFPTWIGVETARKRLSWDTLLDPPEEGGRAKRPALPEVRSRNLESSRMAVLKQGQWQLFFHYGQLDPSHAQAEALNWEAAYGSTDITHDAGTVGYGSPLHREFYTRGQAHNAVLIDGEGQLGWAPGELLGFDPARVAARQPQYRENVSVERDLRIEGDTVEDRVRVETMDQQQHRIGLVLHVQGRVRLPEGFRDDPEFPLKHWEGARTTELSNEAVLLVDYPGLVLEVTVSAGALLRVTHATTPDVPPNRRESLYFELSGQKAEFVTRLRVLRQAAERTAPIEERTEAQRRRVELNLLGAADTESGESRRNENVQFNLVDNNALKELNVRLGVTATIVREFQPDRSYFGAEFGNVPGAPPHAAPGRGQDFHGEARWAHLNSVTTARTFFQVGDVKPARENDAGLRAGGRAWRNAWWQTHGSLRLIRGQVNGNVLVPREDERTALAADPALRAIVQRFLDAYPREAPNRTDINPRALNTNSPQRIDHRMGGARIDQKLDGQDALALVYDFTSQDVDAFQLVAGQNPDSHIKSHRARITWTRTPDARSVMEWTAGFDRLATLLVPEPNSVGPMVMTGGLETLGPQAIIPLDRAMNLFRAAGALRRQGARTAWQAGFEIIRRQMNGAETDAHRGFFSFGNDFGRDAITNLRMGTPSNHIVSIGDIHRGFRTWEPAAYAGGRRRLGPSTDLSYGLRWQAATRPVEVNGRNVVPYDSDWNNWAPSLGLARGLGPRGGVIRAAVGVHFGEIFPVTYSQVRFSPPGSVKIAVPAPDLLDPLRADPQKVKGNIYALDPELATPYSYQYNASWERALGRAARLEAGYVGSRSHRLLIMWYRNRARPVAGVPLTTATINDRRPDTSVADVRWVLNGSRGYYDAARVTLVIPQWRGLSFESAYWFSKAMDLGSAYTNTAYDADSRLSRSQWEYETRGDMKGLSDFDQPHAFLWRGSYSFSSRRAALRGWSLSAVALLKKGTPFTVVSGSDAPGYGNVDGNGGDRPHLLDPSILGRTIGDPDTSNALLPRSAFAYIRPGEPRGNLGRNTFRKGGIANVNAAVSRSWQTDAGVRVVFRAESVNLTNTPQFAPPGFELANPNFGAITNTLNEGRTFRFSLQAGW